MARSRVQSAIMHGPFIIFIPFSGLRMLPRAADCDADGAVGPASATRRASERETTQTKQAKAIIERARDNSARHAIIISTHSTYVHCSSAWLSIGPSGATQCQLDRGRQMARPYVCVSTVESSSRNRGARRMHG